jgi:hypothetical protein
MYSGRVPGITKWEADFTFLSNMIDIVETKSSWVMRVARLHFVMVYFKAVKEFGTKYNKLCCESE